MRRYRLGAPLSARSTQILRIYLASNSPRRRALLAQIGVSFDPVPFRQNQQCRDPDVDETPLDGEVAEDYVKRLALAKAENGSRIVTLRAMPMRPVLAADTCVELTGQIIGKPEDDAHAVSILERLSGRKHKVLTGVALYLNGRFEYALSASEVSFRPLSAKEIEDYIRTGEHRDKAGAYGIQGQAGVFVDYLVGDFNGVMGLPLNTTCDLLRRFGCEIL